MALLPAPMLVNAETGQAYPPLPAESLRYLGRDLLGAEHRAVTAAESGHLAVDYSVGDPDDLTRAGWCILFPSTTDPDVQARLDAIKTQLQPLIDLRESQVQDDGLFKVFEGRSGAKLGQTAENWAMYRGVSLTAPVSPTKGVPYFVLIVGGPEWISFEFQQLLKMQWVVGRLAFDDVEDYGRYAKAVVEYESAGFKPVQSRSAAVWVTRHDGDVNTAVLSGAICDDFVDSTNKLGSDSRCQFELQAFKNEAATWQALSDVLCGKSKGGAPALLFTGSHGAEYSIDNPDQRRMQGALLTQDWKYNSTPNGHDLFSAADVPAEAKVQGCIAFLFACFGGGCPAENSYYYNADGTKKPVANQPMVAALPQALLSHGMLAVIAHVDLAFQWAFEDVNGTPQVQAIRNPLELLMQGKRVGLAADSLSLMWSTLSAQLGMDFGGFALSAAAAALSASGAEPAAQLNTKDATKLANRTIARDDARNYIVLGDPAVRLRVEDLGLRPTSG